MENILNRGLLYPALHKFYSALSSLEKFGKGNDFFDNISYLDNFFSEYRNITFVLQKSIAHTEYEGVYEKNRNEYLVSEIGKWFIEKRNEVLKQQPFNLEKRVLVTIYTPLTSVVLQEKVFTLENDIEYSTLIQSLKSFFVKINPIEVFFSVEFSFFELGKNKELYDDFIGGINKMKGFLQAMKNDIREECKLCEQLQDKINNFNFYRVPKNFLFVDDYVYYSKKNKFEKGHRGELQLSEDPNVNIKAPLSAFFKAFSNKSKEDQSIFDVFILMHIFVFEQQKTLMPTFMIIYENDYFEFISFISSIKTTLYRKINEISKKIEKDKIKAILFVSEMINYSGDKTKLPQIINSNSKERLKYKESESLAFFMTDNKLNFGSYYFESDKIGDVKYITSVIMEKNKKEIYTFFQPFIDVFKQIKK